MRRSEKEVHVFLAWWLEEGEGKARKEDMAYSLFPVLRLLKGTSRAEGLP